MTTTLPTPEDTTPDDTPQPAAGTRGTTDAKTVPTQRTADAPGSLRARTRTRTSIRTAPRPVIRFRSSRPDLLTCLALLTVIVLVQGWNITGFPALSDDEGTYLSQAWAVQQGEGLAHYTYWYDHPPLGWLQLAGLTYLPALLVPEAMTVATMRFAMLLISAVSAVLLFVLARRLFLPRWAAALATALFGLSPLSVHFQREIFLDNIAVLWMLLAFCLAASPRRHLWHQFAAGVAGAVSVLSKETMLLVLPALLLTLWRHSHRDTRKFAVTGAVASCALIGLMYPLYALLNSEFFASPHRVSLVDGIRYQLSRPGSGFVLDPGTGSHKTLEAWLYYDPVLPLAGAAAALLLLLALRWSVTARALAGPALAVALLTLMAFRPDGYLPAMYVIQALPFLALVLAGAAASAVHAILHRRAASPDGRAVRPADGAVRPARTRRVAPRKAAVAALALTAAALLTPRWVEGNHDALTQDANKHYRAAAAWFEERVGDPASTRVLVDDALWLDLVHAGYEPSTGAIWFYKADLDPKVTKTMPRGWRDLDYVVSTLTVRRDAPTLPNVQAALENSTPVAVFGTGDDRIEIRHITGAAADDPPRAR
ncbi:ArnT family glycosyltransferase [Streptomyces sp. NPDC003860]